MRFREQPLLSNTLQAVITSAAESCASSGYLRLEPEHLLAALMSADFTDAQLLMSAFDIDPQTVCLPTPDRLPDRDRAYAIEDVSLSDSSRLVMRAMYAEHRHTVRDILAPRDRKMMSFVDTRHLLLALASGETNTGRALFSAGFRIKEWKALEGMSTAPCFEESVDTYLRPKRVEAAVKRQAILHNPTIGEPIMWELFTERARQAIYHSQEEAGRLGEHYVSTEHLLLGLLRDEQSVAANILDRLGVSPGRIRSLVELQVSRGESRTIEDMQMTPRGKRVLDLAQDESRQLNHDRIGTEHLLLGLIREREGLAGRVLAKLGIDLDRTRDEVRTLFPESSSTGDGQQAASEPVSPPLKALVAGLWKRAEAEAVLLDRPMPSIEHLILAMMGDKNSVVSRMLAAEGVTLEALRQALADIYSEEDGS